MAITGRSRPVQPVLLMPVQLQAVSSVSASPTAALAGATGTGRQPAGGITPAVPAATATGTAYQPQVLSAPVLPVAAATGAGYQPGILAAPPVGLASGTGSALSPPFGHITYRGNYGSAGSGTSATVILPTGWAAGDFATIALAVGATGQNPAATGWSTHHGDGNGYTWCFATRALQGGDSDPVFSWAATAPWDAEASAFTPDGGYTLSVADQPAEVSAGPGTQVTPPSGTALAQDASLIVIAGRAAGTQVPTTYSMTSPAGWTTAGAQEGTTPAGGGGPPAGAPTAPYNVTSITRDAGATVSFREPTSEGDSPVTHYIVTPYIGASAQGTTTVTKAAAGSITAWDTYTYRQVSVSGLTNGTEYTFTVKARNTQGDSAESTASGANTPRVGLVFGDEFNGPAGGPIDPEWWLLDVAATADEDDAYRPTHVRLDGSGHLELKTTLATYKGKPYTSGSVQNNTRSFLPTSGNWLTWETRAQVCSDEAGGMWPCPWTSGTYYQEQYKTDQTMDGWDSTTRSETDICEFNQNSNQIFQTNTWSSSNPDVYSYNAGVNLSLAQHVYRCDWKPDTGTVFYFDGSQIHSQTAMKQTTAQFFMWFMEVKAGTTPSSPQYTYVDYVRIYDRASP